MISQWLETSKAACVLGVSKNTLLKLRSIGVLTAKKHYRKKNPVAARPSYIWNIEKCGEAMSFEPKIGK